MKKNRNMFVGTWMGSIVLAVSLSVGAQAAKKQAPTDMDQSMAEAMQRGTPGLGHKALDPFIGKWSNVVLMWMKPGDAPKESKGTNENTWILGGRFIRQDYRGSFNGQPFEGLGLTGYDNVRGEYQSIWLDNFMTGMMYGTGAYEAKSKTVSVGGTFSCPMTQEKDRWFRFEWKMLDNDHHKYFSYSKDSEGKEFLSMEITFTRSK